MSETQGEGLLRIAEAISDGTPVNWDLEKSGQPANREALERLSVMEKIRDVHRSPVGSTRTADPSRQPGEMELAPGDPNTWGPLRILGKVGEGSYGAVYRAYDPALESEVALKLLKTSDPVHPASADRFLSEARRLARVRHTNVVTVHGADVHDGRVGIWMDFIRGKTLEALLHEHGPFGPHEAALVGIDLCRALAALHAAGLVHCDIKTNNVMREEGGRILLMDFGSAGKSSGAKDALVERGLHGTLISMAPEQLRGLTAGPPTDIYGLGVLLYRLVTIRYPIEGTSYTDLCEKHRSGTLVGLRDRRADLPSNFVEVVHRALVSDPQARYATAGEMERALGATLVALPPPLPPPPLPNWFRRQRRGVQILVTASVLLVLIGGPYLLWSQLKEGVRRGTPATVSPARAPVAPAPLTATATLHRRTNEGIEPLLPGSRISPGDRLDMDIQGSDSMSVYVLNEDAKGQVFVLFPLRGVTPSNPLAPGIRYRLPGQAGDSVLYWNVTSVGRRETVVAIAARRPLRSLEQEIENFPRAVPGRPVTFGKMSPSALHSLRGIGGLSAESPQATGAGRGLSGALRALGERGGPSGDLWVWQIQLENPGPQP